MTEKPKRKFWQFHLLTAVVITMVAGVLVGLNCRPPSVEEGNFQFGEEDFARFELRGRGWPISTYHVWLAPSPAAQTKESFLAEREAQVSRGFACMIFAMNAALSLTMLCVVAYSCEFLVRRREARKT